MRDAFFGRCVSVLVAVVFSGWADAGVVGRLGADSRGAPAAALGARGSGCERGAHRGSGWRVDGAGTDRRGSRSAWSPDGPQIVFSGEVDGDRDLYLVSPDGSGLRQLTSGPGLDREPNWSTRGEIAFVRGKLLYSIRPDGSSLERLDRRGRKPDWSPNGRRLVYSHDRRLYTMRRDGRSVRKLPRRGGGLYPAWSPSGRRIAFRRGRDIYTATSTGGRLRRVHDWGCPVNGCARRDAPTDIDWGPRQL